jgi:formylglycine-generating enzyme required for sulfatase activity
MARRRLRVAAALALAACTTNGTLLAPSDVTDGGPTDAPLFNRDAPSPVDASKADAPAPPTDAPSVDAPSVDAPAADAVADAPGDGPADAGADAFTDAPVSTDATGTDAPDAGPTADASGDAACPGTAGPAPVRIGSFCIDSTEVTNADYAAFLASSSIPAQPAACAWNTSFVPGAWPPAAGTDAYPVVAVDWCDAFTYCAWAGKRLCGAIGGGPTPFASFADPQASQWMNACSAAGTRVFPYGATYDPAACNGKDFPDGGAARPVASLAACQGGTAGVFDMSGNVYEWEDACQGDAGASDVCHYRGGGFFTPGPPTSANLECQGGATLTRQPGAAFLDVGFRCCGF